MRSAIHRLEAAARLIRTPGSRAELTAYRDRQVRRLVAHAYEAVPYWRRLLDAAGVHPRHVRTADDLPLLPTTTKQDLRALPLRDIVTRGVEPGTLIHHTTGGSTGEPFVIWRSWLEERLLGEVRWRALHSFGFRPTDRLVLVVFHHRPAANDSQVLQRILKAAGLHRVYALHCLLPPEVMLEQLRELRPDVIGGYAGVLARIGRYMSAEGSQSIRPRFVLTGAEVLAPQMRTQIEEAFGAPVYDTYGSHEFSRIAWECPHAGGYHVADDGVVVEVLKQDGTPAEPGERGELVGTALHSFAMPFIRYRLGDLVVRGETGCTCGAPYSTIHSIQGRMVDYFHLPDGREIHPFEIAAAAQQAAAGWVRQYQLVQEQPDRVVLRVVPDQTPDHSTLARVQHAARGVLGDGVRFDIEVTEDLRLEGHGKFRVYKSLIHSEQTCDAG